MTDYDLKDVKLPALQGRLLGLAAAALDAPVLGGLASEVLLENGGLTQSRKIEMSGTPTFYPQWPVARESQGTPASLQLQSFEVTASDLPVPRSRDFVAAYQSGRTTPEKVAARILDAMGAFDRAPLPLKAFIAVNHDEVQKQARASAARYRAGKPLSVLDGVPVAVKDEVGQQGYGTTGGTSFWGREPAREDSTVVARLREQGALLIGKTNMHEVGIQPNGLNVHYGQVRNPFDLTRDSGGSSSGSAAAVAAGLCPIAIGADGGGSIRVPASLCGVVGLKSTFGRVSEHGVLPLCWTVGHVGPLAASVEDAALAYAAIAGADAHDRLTQLQPPPTLDGFRQSDLKGVRLGVFREWFEHADPSIVAKCREAIEILVSLGAKVVEVSIPNLDLMRVAHSITILSELATTLRSEVLAKAAFGPSVKMTLIAAMTLKSSDYLWAQKVRTKLMAQWAQMFEGIDILVTPTNAVTAPLLPKPMPKEGWSDLSSTIAVMRFIIAGNFLGLPGLSVPVGYDGHGLPIGLQLTGRGWEEALLLRAGLLLEARVPRVRPSTFIDLLAG